MTAGFAVASLSWLLIALAPSWPMVAVAMAVFALGEAMQAPRFYEYVADLAPKDQVGTFMGFAFLPVAVGSVVGGVLAGALVQGFIRESSRPAGMWWVVAGIGLATTALMVLYDRLVSRGPAMETVIPYTSR